MHAFVAHTQKNKQNVKAGIHLCTNVAQQINFPSINNNQNVISLSSFKQVPN